RSSSGRKRWASPRRGGWRREPLTWKMRLASRETPVHRYRPVSSSSREYTGAALWKAGGSASRAAGLGWPQLLEQPADHPGHVRIHVPPPQREGDIRLDEAFRRAAVEGVAPVMIAVEVLRSVELEHRIRQLD